MCAATSGAVLVATNSGFCEPIAMEILSGAVDDHTHAQLERLVKC